MTWFMRDYRFVWYWRAVCYKEGWHRWSGPPMWEDEL
jgi:hypothetical protein